MARPEVTPLGLLHFPSEPRKFRQLRQWSREQFQREIRGPALARLGGEATDLGVLIMACGRCGLPTSTLHVFSDLPLDLSRSALEDALRRLWGSERQATADAFCASCHAGSGQLTPVVAHFGRVLAESGRDLQVEVLFGEGRILRMEYHRMDPDGTCTPVGTPADELAFFDTYQAPLSMRTLWSDFLARNLSADSLVTRQIQPGYIIGLRPFAEDESEAVAFYAGFEKWIERRRRELPYDTVTFFRDREEDGIPVPEAESYHAWLPAFAPDIADALVDPFIVADSDTFIRVLDEIATRRGVRVARASGEDTLFARFTAGEVEARLNVGPRYFRILHSGQTFHRGVITHFAKEILAIAAAGQLPPMLRARLPGLRVRVRDGKLLEIADALERRLFVDDVIRVATAHPVHTEAGLEEVVRRILPSAGSLQPGLAIPRPPG